MATHHVFSDETGNFDFSRGPDATRFFGVGTLEIATRDARGLRADLATLHDELVESGATVDDHFHASNDKQEVRDKVVEVLQAHSFRFDATMLDKPKALPRVRATDQYFFKHAWYYHFKHHAHRLHREGLLVVAASLGDKKQRVGFKEAIEDVLDQCLPGQRRHFGFVASKTDYGLQAVDYCLWAVFRKYERGDTRTYDALKSKIATDFDLFRTGTVEHY